LKGGGVEGAGGMCVGKVGGFARGLECPAYGSLHREALPAYPSLGSPASAHWSVRDFNADFEWEL
jgi:hypothetical protein